MKLYQLNLNYCKAAQDLLQQSVLEQKIDVAILCEQYRNFEESSTRYSESTGKAAIWICGDHFIQEYPSTMNNGFTWVKVQNTYICSVYAPPLLPPSLTQAEFETMLDKLANELQGRFPCIVAGDFNAWATNWGSPFTNQRGEALLEAFTALDLVLANNNLAPTFMRNGNISFIDLTFTSDSLAPRNSTWCVSDSFTYSDHQAIVFEVDLPGQQHQVNTYCRGWNAKSFDREAFIVMMEERMVLTGSPEVKASQLMSLIGNACDASMSRRSKGNRHRPVYWWNNEISQLRKICHQTRRRAQRGRRQANYLDLRQAHSEVCRNLKKAIKSSKRRGWKELYKEVDKDP